MIRLPNAEMMVGCAGVLLAGTVMAATIGGRPAVYEPLGPWAFPRALAILIGLFAAGILVAGLRRERHAADVPEAWPIVIAVYLIAVAYVAALTFGLLGFRPATLAFLLVLGIMLSDRSPKALAITGAIAIVLSFGVYALLTGVLYVSLP